MDEEGISTFSAITGASSDIARSFLSLTGDDVERAIELYFENPDLVSNVQTGVPPPVPNPSTRPSAGREDASGIIHIDSGDDDDDDDIMELEDNDSDQDDAHVAAVQAAALAQEAEDAAMAKRLQEELYQENNGSGSGAGGMMGADDVRAPIGRTTETLVAPDASWPGGHDDEVESAILAQLRRRRQAQCKLKQKYPHVTVRLLTKSGNSSSDRRPVWAANMGGRGPSSGRVG
jgi:hypothetical protein